MKAKDLPNINCNHDYYHMETQGYCPTAALLQQNPAYCISCGYPKTQHAEWCSRKDESE